ncbi:MULTISPECIES: hypothetical protein [Pseudomonas]|jgi:hypothetical protein|uniref:hypothetical protein n=2 Tax=Pseudomonas TaxID=286 RepID=UPI00117AF2F5|nr:MULTISPECIES: hypothetical protein [Pseudomonas]MCK3847141.1 hypothetical protein [Pseudomonas sp. W15Feb34]MCK3852764.1 hypothetical protein [Pseudomonas sp. W2Jun17]MCK3864024.1 hypothetical protein [Pseudomonas sp. B329]UEH06046.1 hypothetical protein LJX92_13775 [Pseudomonas sp. HN8-3]WPN51548.1 hypothetical protein QMK52_21980 [Pseudomonas sp. P9_2]
MRDEKMFSHEGTAIELLTLVFAVTGVLLIAWFIHHQYELRSRKRVKKQQGGNQQPSAQNR